MIRGRCKVGLAVGLALLSAPVACSSSTDEPTATTSTSAAAAGTGCAPNPKFPASPTVEMLDGKMRLFFDGSVPAEQKVHLVQGSERDPDVYNRMAAALQGAGLSYKINSVTDYCDGTANADATLTVLGQTNDVQVPLVASGNDWTLELGWACGLAKNLQVASPICP